MNKSKITILSIFFIIILLIVIVVLVFANNSSSGNNDTNPNNNNQSGSNPSEGNRPVIINDYIILDNDNVWRVNNDIYYDESDYDIDDKFETYINNVYKGEFKFKHIKVWNIIGLNESYIQNESKLFAYTSNNLNITLKNFNIEKINENDLRDIENIMNLNIDMEELYNNRKVIIDIDNNGINDEIISVSNINIDNVDETKQHFNLVYVNYNNQRNILIKENVELADLLITPAYNINYILRINNINSIIIKEVHFSEGGINNILFQYKEDKFVKIKN